MGMVVKISTKNNSKETQKALRKLAESRTKKKKTLSDFYGKMPGVYGDGIEYQKKVRDEWT
jgi:hypothetical protein